MFHETNILDHNTVVDAWSLYVPRTKNVLGVLLLRQNRRRTTSLSIISDDIHGNGVKIFRSNLDPGDDDHNNMDNDDMDHVDRMQDLETCIRDKGEVVQLDGDPQSRPDIFQAPQKRLHNPLEKESASIVEDSSLTVPCTSIGANQELAEFANHKATTENVKKAIPIASSSTSFASTSSANTPKSPKVCESLRIDDTDTISKSLIESIQYQNDETQLSLFLEKVLKWTPVTIPIVAFLLYDPTAMLFSSALQSLSSGQMWVAVDGGQYQAKIITPAINGIVVQAIAILFAVLIGNTISNLRQRQMEICKWINYEATQIRILFHLVVTSTNYYYYAPHQQQQQQQALLQYLVQYTSRLIAEGHETTNVQALETNSNSQDTELYGVLAVLSTLHSPAPVNGNEIMNTNTSPQQSQFPPVSFTVSTLILDKCYETTFRLLDARSQRLTALSSTFPPLHYVIIAMLAVSMCAAFLMETDQDILVFLNAIQLRLLWTSLVGTFCALGVVLYDLGQPFRGSYQVTKAVNQLYSLRNMLQRRIKDGAAAADTTTATTIVNGSVTNMMLDAQDTRTSTELGSSFLQRESPKASEQPPKRTTVN